MAWVTKTKCLFCNKAVLELNGKIFEKNGKNHDCKGFKRAKKSSGFRGE